MIFGWQASKFYFVIEIKVLLIYQKYSFKKLTFNHCIFAAAGLARPAPAELPQGGNAARVGGCSGAM